MSFSSYSPPNTRSPELQGTHRNAITPTSSNPDHSSQPVPLYLVFCLVFINVSTIFGLLFSLYQCFFLDSRVLKILGYSN
ncbi:hypothetical protein HanRHA438_Chr06g0283311 [Helianthus annuus]|nr:hypothetical protein HanRHA438_Chr06g0283311 [Helianthus annuus]